MHIAITVGQFDLTGGIERVTVALAKGYQALGHDVTILATDWDPAFADRFRFERVHAPAHPAWLRTLTLPGATSRRLAQLGRFDLIHGQGTSTLTCDLLTFHSVHAAWLDVSVGCEPEGSWKRTAKRLYPFHRAAIAMEAYQVAHHRGMIHACSQEVRDEVIRYYHADPDRVVAVPWGIDLEVFRPDVAAGRAERERWGVPAGATVLLLMANEFHRKGLKPILEAMAELDRADVHLAVAGRGEPEPYRPLVSALGLESRVHFLGNREAAPCYQAADLFVMPSTYEGWGLVVPEALACGLPTVVSRFPASNALVRTGENGILLDDPTDALALARALERALSERDRLAENARPSVAHLSWPEVCRRILEVGLRASPSLA